MAGPTILVTLAANVAAFQTAVGKVGDAGKMVAGTLHTAFSGVLGTLNQTGVLGPFGAALDGVDKALGTIAEHGKATGVAMMGVGGAIAGIGVGLQALGSKDQAAHQQLQQSIESTGKSYDEFGDQIDQTIKKMEKYGDTSAETQTALRKLTDATHDPQKALDLMGEAADLAASKHIGLGDAAGALGKIVNGNTKLLKPYGIEIDKTTGLTKDGHTATQALADVLSGQASASADTFSGHLAGIRAHLEDTAAQMGQKYGPAITGVGSLLAGLGAAWSVISAIMAADWFAAFWPIGLIVLAIAAVGIAIYLMRDKIGEVLSWIAKNWELLVAILLGPFAIAAYYINKFFGDDIRKWIGDAVNWIIGAWNGVVDFFTKLPGRIVAAFVGLGRSIAAPFVEAWSLIARLWNDSVGKLNFKIPSWVPGVGGKEFGMPSLPIPALAAGGLITASGLVFAHAGEVITPAPAGMGGPLVEINGATFNSAVDVDMIAKRLELATRAGVRLAG